MIVNKSIVLEHGNFWYTNVSQGSVVICLRCVEIVNHFNANLLENLPESEINLKIG